MAGRGRFVALDVGAGGVKLAAFVRHRSGQLELLDYRFASFDVASSEGMAQEAVVASAVNQLLTEMHLSGFPAVVSLAGYAVFSRVVTLPPVAGDRLVQMVRHEAVQHIPFPIDEVVWDYRLFGDAGEVLLVAAKAELVEGLAYAVEAAGLAVDVFDTAPSSLYSAVRFAYPESSGSTLIVDLGAQSVDLVFMDGGRVFFRSLPMGGGVLAAYDLDDEATQLLLTRITQEISRSISFYKSKQGGNAPELILLSGGMAGLPGIDVWLPERLKVKVERLNPLSKIKLGVKVDAAAVAAEAYRFGELVGLAVGFSGAGTVSFNLMPEAILKARVFSGLQPLIVAGAAVAVLIAGVWAAGLSLLTRLVKEESAQVKARGEALEMACAELEPVASEMAELGRDCAVYLLVMKRHTLWLETLLDLKEVIPDGMFLTSLEPVFSGEGSERMLKGLRIAGIAYLDKHGEDDAIKKLRNLIRQSPRFGDGTEVIKSPAKKTFAREFEMDVVLAEAVHL